ncbi:sulfotransferase [Yoonia sp. BS5-3]|uniref:Sulfotransferase n=1 Tax=Yoonia phaeophyticola TaxID=3137369 RepID=A0ABZ2V287_9RHOB
MMSETNVLFCVGATKAGTSWLYRYLHDHPDCAMPAVKEAHYWDTFEPEALDKQATVFRVRLRELRDMKIEAREAGQGWKVKNLDRRINEMKGLLAVLEGDRAGDAAYRAWLTEGRGNPKLVADMTPNYATLPDEFLARMMGVHPHTKVVLLIRDPLDRLWSHIRMQARRQRQDHEVYEKKANNILYRMLNRDHERHILARGDYPKIIRKLRRVVPEDRLHVQFTEELFTTDGTAAICDFLGIAPVAAEVKTAVHEGPEVVMLDKLRPRALGLLNEHYEWVARNIGPLPQRWQDNRAKG